MLDELTNNTTLAGETSDIFRVLSERYQHVRVIENAHSVADAVKISVCIPTYQHAATIGSCLESVLEQQVDFPYEILVGEDDSTDGTREICLRYASRHPDKIRLFLHSRENNIKINGQASGRFNFLYLLSKARGEYIAICEGDDRWTDRRKLAAQLQAMIKVPGCQISCHPAMADSRRYAKFDGMAGYHGRRQKIFSATEIINYGGGFCATLSILFHRSVLSRLPSWFIEAPVLDFYLLIIASLQGGCLYLPTANGVYGSSHAGSWTNRLFSNPAFAVKHEKATYIFLDKLANEVGGSNVDAVCRLQLKRKISSVFARHLPRAFRLSVYKEIRKDLAFKYRVAWFVSFAGRVTGPVRWINDLLKYIKHKSLTGKF